MAWYIEDFCSWDPRYAPRFKIDLATWWLGGADLLVGKKLDKFSDQVVRASQTSRHKSVPDFFMVGQVHVCSQPFKDIVENLEAGVHQFFPVQLIDRQGKEIPTRYYIFNVLCTLDAINLDRSSVYKVEWGQPYGDGQVLHLSRFAIQSPSQLVVHKEQCGARHLWRTVLNIPRLLFFSDSLMQAVNRAKLKKFTAYHASEE